jgi:hypothetical protein
VAKACLWESMATGSRVADADIPSSRRSDVGSYFISNSSYYP